MNRGIITVFLKSDPNKKISDQRLIDLFENVNKDTLKLLNGSGYRIMYLFIGDEESSRISLELFD